MRPDDLRPKSDLHLTTGDLLQDLRVVLVLGRVDARLEIVYRIVWKHGHLVLEDDGALVVLLIRKMNGDSRHLVPCLEGILDSMRATMLGQQRRVQVDHAIGKRIEQDGRDLAHVACHRDVLDVVLLERLDDPRIDSFGIVIISGRENQQVKTLVTRVIDALGIIVRRDDELDCRIERAVLDRIVNCLLYTSDAADEL